MVLIIPVQAMSCHLLPPDFQQVLIPLVGATLCRDLYAFGSRQSVAPTGTTPALLAHQRNANPLHAGLADKISDYPHGDAI